MNTVTTPVMAPKRRPASRRHPEVAAHRQTRTPREDCDARPSKGGGAPGARHPPISGSPEIGSQARESAEADLRWPARLAASCDEEVVDARAPQDDGDGTAINRAALYRLMAWLSPAYPVGAFSYSSGIEWAVEAGDVTDAVALTRWIAMMVGDGGGFCDAVLLAHAYRATAAADETALQATAELAVAFAPSKERHLETTAQGGAFVEITRAAWPTPALDRLTEVSGGAIALPVAIGVAGAGHGVPLEPLLQAYLQAAAVNLISAGVRLVPLGQTDGQRVLAALEPVIATAAKRALATPLDDMAGAAFRTDLASMRHETQYTRLFRS
jgi:urease accessory protein